MWEATLFIHRSRKGAKTLLIQEKTCKQIKLQVHSSDKTKSRTLLTQFCKKIKHMLWRQRGNNNWKKTMTKVMLDPHFSSEQEIKKKKKVNSQNTYKTFFCWLSRWHKHTCRIVLEKNQRDEYLLSYQRNWFGETERKMNGLWEMKLEAASGTATYT